MAKGTHRINWTKGIMVVLAVTEMLLISSCGNFFNKKPTEWQTRKILNELGQVRENPNLKNPLPELYRGPAERIKTKNGIKLFYFTKHHSCDKLAALLKSQLGLKVDISNPTNQLIINCSNDDEANTALEFLQKVDVPPIQVNIDCLILERFADVTMDWETTLLIQNLLGEKITLGGKTDENGNILPAFPGASLRESKRSTFGLDVGYWRNKGVNGHEFRALVDMLVSRGYLKILMNPTLETVNGQKARIVSRENVPLEKILAKEGYDEPFSLTDYQWVEDILEVTPHVFADGSIGLETHVQIGSKSKPEGVVQVSVITERAVQIAENRIKPGDSLVIGGIRKSENRSVIRGVPFLKDIPFLGVLFSSKDYEEKATEVIFILTPTFSAGGVEYAKVADSIREKFATPSYSGLEKVLTDPFGSSAYTESMEKEAAQAKFEQFKAELQKAEALEQVDKVKKKLLEAAREVLAEKQKTAKAHKEAQAAKEQARKAVEEAMKIKQQMEKAKADAARTNAQKEKSKEQEPTNRAEEKHTNDNDPNQTEGDLDTPLE